MSNANDNYLRCPCGGYAYTLGDLLIMSDSDPEGVGYADMYRSFLSPLDLYCVDEDDVLTEEEVWKVIGFTTPIHDVDQDPEW